MQYKGCAREILIFLERKMDVNRKEIFFKTTTFIRCYLQQYFSIHLPEQFKSKQINTVVLRNLIPNRLT